MGCDTSNIFKSSVFYDDPDFTDEALKRKRTLNKSTGLGEEKGDGNVLDHDEAMEEDPLFKEEDEKTEEFMAVRPWIGQIAEPINHNPFNPAIPDERYELDYVYGYRSADTRQNVKYNSTG